MAAQNNANKRLERTLRKFIARRCAKYQRTSQTESRDSLRMAVRIFAVGAVHLDDHKKAPVDCRTEAYLRRRKISIPKPPTPRRENTEGSGMTPIEKGDIKLPTRAVGGTAV